MRNFLVFLMALCIFLSWKSHAQLRPAQAQYLEERGFLVNPGFEQGYKGWTVSGCTKSLVSEVPFLNKSLKLTCVAEAFSIKQESTSHNALAGQQGIYDLQIKSNADGVSVAHLAGGNRVAELSTPTYGLTTFRRINNIPFVVNGTSNGIEIYSDALFTGEVIIDNVKLSLADDQLIREDYDDMPLGTVISYSGPTNPAGYLDADGSCLLKAGEYSGLYAAIGITYGECTVSVANDGFNLPELNTLGRYIRGAGGAVALGTYQNDATAVNGLSADQSGHSHTDGMGAEASTNTRYGLVSTTTQFLSNDYGNSQFNANYSRSVRTSTEDPAITVSSIDSETRPISLALKYIIKAKGRSPRALVSQKSPAPFKAGFITWAAFSGPMEGHLVADGSCILESAYPDFIENTGADTFGDCTISTAGDGSRLPDLVTDNRFIRSAGGSLAVGQTQQDTTAVNGLSVNSGGTHSHNFLQGNGDNSNNGYIAAASSASGSAGTRFSPNSVQSGGSHSHGLTSSQSETAPNSIALTPYVRMVNANEIQGDFAEIEEVKFDLDASTANEFYVKIDNTGNVLSENHDVIAGNCTRSGTNNGIVSCTYNPGIFTVAPTVNGGCRDDNCYVSYANAAGSSTTGFTVAVRNDTATLVNRGIDIVIGKQGADVNKNTINRVVRDSTLEHYNLGDCKWSLLDTADFNELHTGKWARLEGQSIAGTELDNRFGISSLPNGVGNGAFLRMNGGLSGSLRTIQQDADQRIQGSLFAESSNNVHGLFKASTGAFTLDTATNGTYGNFASTSGTDRNKYAYFDSANVVDTADESRPTNISLNFYCLIGE